MEFTFWGTRGSIANASPHTIRHGGNTSCVEVRSQSGTLIVLDCGTGGYALGQALMGSPQNGKRGHLLISHTHWDHIQGIPFFAPLFDPASTWDIYAPQGLHQSLRNTLAGQMNYSYSPITLEDMGATINFHELVEGVFTIEDFAVTTHFLNHPALTLGYRLEADGVSIVYACDHEPISKQGNPTEADLLEAESRHIEFLRDADVVIHDTQYTAEEYPDKIGWGHSTIEYAVAVCIKAGVRKLVLTHHEPNRSDKELDSIVKALKLDLQRAKIKLQVVAATERKPSKVKKGSAKSLKHRAQDKSARPVATNATESYAVVLGSLRAEAHKVLRLAATQERCKVLTGPNVVMGPDTSDSSATLGIFDTHTPTAEIERFVASNSSQEARQSVFLINYLDERDAGADQEQLVTERFTWPFSEQYARAQIQAWILRTACRWVRADLPPNEVRRLGALHALKILRTPPEERFDRITRLAAEQLQVPIALVSLVDTDTQWFKSCIGLDVDETSREVAFCAHAILENRPLVVPDTLLDLRFADNPLVKGAPHIRFYAGCPLLSPDGYPLGTLCMIDTKPRHFNGAQLRMLTDFAAQVRTEIMQPREGA